jgi:hypothetical protein
MSRKIPPTLVDASSVAVQVSQILFASPDHLLTVARDSYCYRSRFLFSPHLMFFAIMSHQGPVGIWLWVLAHGSIQILKFSWSIHA